MFQDDTDINCYNLLVSDYDGSQVWDFEIFNSRHPEMGQQIKSQFEAGILSFDVDDINYSLI